MIELGALFGTGDVYLTCALARAVRDTHKDNVTVIVKPGHEAIARLFPASSYRVERHEPAGKRPAFPEHIRQPHPAQPPRLCASLLPAKRHPRGLPLPLCRAFPTRICSRPSCTLTWMPMWIAAMPSSASVAATSSSCRARNHGPILGRGFGMRLSSAPAVRSWMIHGALRNCSHALHQRMCSFGPQCGVSMIAAHAQFGCRKIICSMDFEHAGFPGLPQKRAAPYCFSELFAGEVYDMEEILVTSETSRAANKVMLALTRPQTGKPLNLAQIHVNVGEFIDRWIIGMMKEERTGRRTDFNRLDALVRYYVPPQELIDRLAAANREEWDVIERINHAFSGGTLDAIPGDHIRAVELNRVRVGIKNEINRIMKSSPEVNHMTDIMHRIDEIVRAPNGHPDCGWHDDHRAVDGTPAYLPAIQQVRERIRQVHEGLHGPHAAQGTPAWHRQLHGTRGSTGSGL